MSDKTERDPAFLFYYSDFMLGTIYMTNEVLGVYIRLLCLQADKGYISVPTFESTCQSEDIYNDVIHKFVFDEELDGYYNIRLRKEQEKRRKFAESRRNNRKGKPAGKVRTIGGSRG